MKKVSKDFGAQGDKAPTVKPQHRMAGYPKDVAPASGEVAVGKKGPGSRGSGSTAK